MSAPRPFPSAFFDIGRRDWGRAPVKSITESFSRETYCLNQVQEGILCCFNGNGGRCLPDAGKVGGLIHEGVYVGRIRGLDFEEPAGAVRVGIDKTGVGSGFAVHFDDFAGDGSVDITGGFNGFNDGDRFTRGDSAAGSREFDINDIAEFRLGVVRNADG